MTNLISHVEIVERLRNQFYKLTSVKVKNKLYKCVKIKFVFYIM